MRLQSLVGHQKTNKQTKKKKKQKNQPCAIKSPTTGFLKKRQELLLSLSKYKYSVHRGRLGKKKGLIVQDWRMRKGLWERSRFYTFFPHGCNPHVEPLACSILQTDTWDIHPFLPSSLFFYHAAMNDIKHESNKAQDLSLNL